MSFWSAINPITGIINAVGNQVQKNRQTFKGDEENAQVREHENTQDARNFKPQGWLGKQIRPFATLILLSPMMAITVIITVLTIVILLPLINSLEDFDESVELLKQVFGLYDVLSENYWEILKIVISFWFGGRIIQHAMASNTLHQHVKNGGKLVGKVVKNAVKKNKTKNRNNSALAEFQNRRHNRDN